MKKIKLIDDTYTLTFTQQADTDAWLAEEAYEGQKPFGVYAVTTKTVIETMAKSAYA